MQTLHRYPVQKRLGTFLANKEYEISDLAKLENYVLVENILIQKVYTYAIAYVGGAANGEYLYTEAVRDLLTWRAVFEGARWQAGILADDF